MQKTFKQHIFGDFSSRMEKITTVTVTLEWNTQVQEQIRGQKPYKILLHL